MAEKEPPPKPAKGKHVLLGPDGKPCRACSESTSFLDWSKKATKKAAGGSMAAAETSFAQRKECPPDSEALGRATWTFLHTTAAYYPESPSASHQKQMLALLKSLPTLYPCNYCAQHLGQE